MRRGRREASWIEGMKKNGLNGYKEDIRKSKKEVQKFSPWECLPPMLLCGGQVATHGKEKQEVPSLPTSQPCKAPSPVEMFLFLPQAGGAVASPSLSQAGKGVKGWGRREVFSV